MMVIIAFLRVLRCLGKGSYGAVYKARDLRTSELVAIKVISLCEGVLFRKPFLCFALCLTKSAEVQARELYFCGFFAFENSVLLALRTLEAERFAKIATNSSRFYALPDLLVEVLKDGIGVRAYLDGLMMQEEGYEEIRGEIEMLQQCNHPNVVRYLGSYQGEDYLWVRRENPSNVLSPQ